MEKPRMAQTRSWMTKQISFGVIMFCIFLLMATVSVAQDPEKNTRNLEFSWEQTMSPDFAGWKLYAKEGGTSGNRDLANYVPIADIPYSGEEMQTYSAVEVILSPKDTPTRHWFVVTSIDNDGNESAASNEVSTIIEFVAPGVPIKLMVKIKAKPQ